jgi:thioredoxin reductase (NADPH)
MAAAAAAAAMARQEASKLSISELKEKLRAGNVDTSGCFEKTDLINLYVRTVGRTKFEPEVNNRPRARPPPQQPPRASPNQPRRPMYDEYYNSRSSSRLPSFSWQNALMVVFLAMYVYKNYFQAGADSEFGEVEYDGKGSSAYTDGVVMEVGTHDHFKQILQQHKDDTGLPVVVDFFSHSCGPCRMIAPAYKRLAHEMKGEAVFLKIDVNRNYETSRACFISSMPTFQFYLNGKKRGEFSGANSHELQRRSRQLADEAKQIGVYVDKEVTKESLEKFYKDAGDESKAETSGALAEKYSKKTAKLMRMLKKKYGKQPEVTGRAQGEPTATSVDADDIDGGFEGDTMEPRMSGNTASVKGVRFDITAIPQRMLMDEVARRREEREADEETLFSALTILKPVERVIIVGGGPAGLSAAVYASRAGLEPVVIAPSFGGQLLGKGVDVENYPGVVGHDATGRGLVQMMRRQAHRFGTRLVNEAVVGLKRSGRKGNFELILNDTKRSSVFGESVVIATGASSRWLGVKGEFELRGTGVSSCATCDGFLYLGQPVVVVGGGDTAMEDALVLARTSSKVTIVHRRDDFHRASFVLSEKVKKNSKINILWNSVVKEFVSEVQAESGKNVLTKVRIETTSGGDGGTVVAGGVDCKGAFVAIGHDPNTKFLKDLLEMDSNGYLETHGTKTSVEGIFAAGDVADHVYRQAITSAGSGAMAALDVEKYLSA